MRHRKRTKIFRSVTATHEFIVYETRGHHPVYITIMIKTLVVQIKRKLRTHASDEAAGVEGSPSSSTNDSMDSEKVAARHAVTAPKEE